MKNIKVTFEDSITMDEVLKLHRLMKRNFWKFLWKCPVYTKIETEKNIFEITYDGIEITSKKTNKITSVSWFHIDDLLH